MAFDLNRMKLLVVAYYKDVIVGGVLFSVCWVLLYNWVAPPLTVQMITRSILDEGSLKYTYTPYAKISPYVKVCAMASEDQNLPFHSGMDIAAIQKAMHVNRKGRKIFGASTISQQVAKNVFLFPQRSYIRKALELYFTLWIETLWTKEKILEMYLNVAETGTLTFGVDCAAQKYFRKSAAQLSLKESAAIVSVLPNPRKYNAANPGRYVADRQNEIVQLFYSLDGVQYLRELYVRADKSLYDFRKYKR